MNRAARLALLSAAFTLGLATSATATVIYFHADLSGSAEAPPNASPGTGIVDVSWDKNTHMMRVQSSFSGLLGVTSDNHIHCCTAAPFTGTIGVASPFGAFFPLNVTSGTFDHTFNMALSSSYTSAFITNFGGGTVAGAEAALLAGMVAGKSYYNIHTKADPADISPVINVDFFPGGEIRGFLAVVPEPATIGVFGVGLALAGWMRRRRNAPKASARA